jgi:N-methylhydantoinase A
VHGGHPVTWKVPSTPRDPARALRGGLAALLERLGTTEKHVELVYGSTIATNALLERRGARTGLVTTAGFEDVLEIGRQARPNLYDLDVERPAPLVPRRLRYGVDECVVPQGKVERRLGARDADTVAGALAGAGVESVAVCLLSSYANPANERVLERALRRRGLAFTSSHRLQPEHREYERTSTTVVNAYLLPHVGAAVRELRRRVRVHSFSTLQSNGGRLSVEAAAREPVRLLLSGPAGGAIGAWEVAKRSGVRRAVGFDMGGTSTDVCLLLGGPPERLHQTQVAGTPVRVPMLDIHTVGAGGGSIARRDAGGALCVGPESAGADPGPACLGRGSSPTVTDAHVVLGRIRPERFLGGRLPLDPQRASRAVGRLARALNMDVERTALGILRVADATMEGALRVVSLERGHDPRGLAMVSFGGAGGLHAASLVRALDLRGALIPTHAAVLSALGMVHADIERDYTRTLLRRLPVRGLQTLYEPLVQRARRELRAEGVTRPILERRLDLRYVGQSWELQVPYSRHFERDFHRLHERQFGFAARSEPIELVALRLRAVGPVRAPRRTLRRASRAPERLGHVPMWFEVAGRPRRLRTALVDDQTLGRETLRGPALVLRDDTTILVPPEFRLSRCAGGDLWLEPARRGRSLRRRAGSRKGG